MIKRTLPLRPIIVELPWAPYPSLSSPAFFYKVRNRVAEGRSVLLVGLQLHRMRKTEQDHILYLLQIFNCECPRVKLHLIQPNLIYAEFKIDLVDAEEQAEDVIAVEQKLFELLRTVQLHFSQFILANFNEKVVFSSRFDPQKFIDSFMQNVVNKVKQKEEKIFSKGKPEY